MGEEGGTGGTGEGGRLSQAQKAMVVEESGAEGVSADIFELQQFLEIYEFFTF